MPGSRLPAGGCAASRPAGGTRRSSGAGEDENPGEMHVRSPQNRAPVGLAPHAPPGCLRAVHVPAVCPRAHRPVPLTRRKR
jgi:hypothetical protein